MPPPPANPRAARTKQIADPRRKPEIVPRTSISKISDRTPPGCLPSDRPYRPVQVIRSAAHPKQSGRKATRRPPCPGERMPSVGQDRLCPASGGNAPRLPVRNRDAALSQVGASTKSRMSRQTGCVGCNERNESGGNCDRLLAGQTLRRASPAASAEEKPPRLGHDGPGRIDFNPREGNPSQFPARRFRKLSRCNHRPSKCFVRHPADGFRKRQVQSGKDRPGVEAALAQVNARPSAAGRGCA